MPAEQHHDGLELPHCPWPHRSVQQYSSLCKRTAVTLKPAGGCRRQPLQHVMETQSPHLSSASLTFTFRALTGEVPSREGAEPVRLTMRSGEAPSALRGMATGLVADMPDGRAANADARVKPVPCRAQQRHPMHRVCHYMQHALLSLSLGTLRVA